MRRGGEFVHIGRVVADVLAQIGKPLPEYVPSIDRAVDPVLASWLDHDSEHVPPSSVFARARQIADDETLIRLVNRLAWSRLLRRYAVADRFVELARYYAAEAKQGAPAA